MEKKTNIDELQEIRVLVENSEAGIIIGKAGSNIKKIRGDTGAFISILKNEQPGPPVERVMVLKGTVEANSQVMRHVAELLLVASEMEATTYTLRILIHKFLSGCIIGKGGTIIREIQTESGSQMRLSNEPLGNSTEKTVTVTGTPEVIEAATFRIFTQLYENPLRDGCGSVLYVPGYGMHQFGMSRDVQSHGSRGGEGYGDNHMYGGQMGHNNGGSFNHKRTEKIVIPTVCAGFLIGKGGTIIGDIRSRSNVANISVANPEPTTPDDRVVSITGQPHAIQQATNLIRQRIESYNYDLGGGQGGGQPGPPQGMGMGGMRMGGMGSPPPVQQMTPRGRNLVQKIVIPTECCGYVIGKGGKTISDIRAKSAVANISLAPPEPTAPNDRVVSITGTAQGIAIATGLIRERVHNYKPNNLMS